MKKFVWGIVLLLIIPIGVKAADIDYTISNQYIKADIEENGDLTIQELVVLDGTFNGYEKTLMYANSLLEDEEAIYNARSLSLISLKAKYVSDVSFDTFLDDDFTTLTKNEAAYVGSKGFYQEKNEFNGYTYRLYYPAKNNKVAFLITYKLEKAVVLHDDFAELYWNFISPNDYDDINDVIVRVNLPKADNSSLFRLWLHTDLAGYISKNENDDGVEASIQVLDSASYFDIRLTFDKNIITDTSNLKTSDMTLEEIIEVETSRANIANNLRKELKAKRTFTIVSTILLYGAFIGLSIYIYFKYGKSPKSGYFSKYNREFIDDYNVEVVDYLMNRKITPNAMSASIMNLIYKKNISALEYLDEKSKKNEKDYIFTLENMDNINDSEKILIDFLFDNVGKDKVNSENKKQFTTIDLKKYANGTKTCNTFINSYTKWKNNVLEKAKNENFYITSATPKILGIVMIIITFLLVVYASSYEVQFAPTYFLIFLAILFLIYCLIVYKKTERGSLHYDKWKAFKNFLDDFGTFELKELPEVVLWERYLVYATVFGLAQKVQKSMNVKIQELDINNINYFPSYVYINMGNTITSSVNNAISNAYQRQAANYANTHSASSSGGGFGGGASFGGGFGGGGSSGHGF